MATDSHGFTRMNTDEHGLRACEKIPVYPMVTHPKREAPLAGRIHAKIGTKVGLEAIGGRQKPGRRHTSGQEWASIYCHMC